jgi:hypothetical protein
MTTNNPPRINPFLHLLLFIFAFVVGIETGAASFVTVVVFPLWASSAEAAAGWVPGMPYHLEEGDFFMYASSTTMLASVITLIAGWRAPTPVRKWILTGTIGFIIVFVWSVLYFIPIQDTSFKGEAGAQFSTEVLESKLKTFVQLNYLRVAMLYGILATALHALGLSYRMRYSAGPDLIE